MLTAKIYQNPGMMLQDRGNWMGFRIRSKLVLHSFNAEHRSRLAQ